MHKKHFYTYNISLFPFHKFMRDGKIYLLNIIKMTTYQISNPISLALDNILSNDNFHIPSKIMAKLLEMGLIDNSKFQKHFQINRPGSISSKKKEMPVTSISLNISQSCNLNCTYCYGDGGSYGKEGLMNERTATQAIEWFLEYSKGAKKISINFFGGEPMMNFPLIKFIVHYTNERAKECNKSIRYSITTNGTLLDTKSIDFLKEKKIKPLVSFDGPPEIQNKNRSFKNGGATHQTVVANLNKLFQKMPRSGCRATIMHTDSIEDVKQGIIDAGFIKYSFAKASSSLLGNYSMESIKMTDNNKMFKFLENEAADTLKCIKIRSISNQGFRLFFRRLNNLISKRKCQYGCKAGRDYVGISIDGDIFPCHRFIGTENTKLGNIWEKEVDRKLYYSNPVTSLLKCKNCWARFFCGGGCMYMNKVRTGHIHWPDTDLCEDLKFSVEIAIHLFHQLDESDIIYLEKESSVFNNFSQKSQNLQESEATN